MLLLAPPSAVTVAPIAPAAAELAGVPCVVSFAACVALGGVRLPLATLGGLSVAAVWLAVAAAMMWLAPLPAASWLVVETAGAGATASTRVAFVGADPESSRISEPLWVGQQRSTRPNAA